MLMKVWHCYFENCNNDSNFQCQITASQRKKRWGGGERKIYSCSNRVCHQPGCARQMDHEYCLDTLCLSEAVVSKDKQWDAGLSNWEKPGCFLLESDNNQYRFCFTSPENRPSITDNRPILFSVENCILLNFKERGNKAGRYIIIISHFNWFVSKGLRIFVCGVLARCWGMGGENDIIWPQNLCSDLFCYLCYLSNQWNALAKRHNHSAEWF